MKETKPEQTKVEETPAEEIKIQETIETSNAAEGREKRLEKLAKNHILASMGVGLIPLPLVDLLALTGIQLDLIKKLAAEYDVPFKKDIGKSILSSLVGGLLPTELGGLVASMVKIIPVIGQTTGAVAMPVISGASTYAVYKVFVQHFESGGTFLDMNPAKVKAFFCEQFGKGKKVASDLKAEETSTPAA